jgi:ribonuclease BN (tRNA processing enzyme)
VHEIRSTVPPAPAPHAKAVSDHAPMDLSFLGSGNAFAAGRCWSGFILNGKYAFDAPPTALLSLKRLGMDPGAIETVLLSHFHGDHFYGLAFLLLEYAYETKRRSDLTIVGPKGVQERVETLMDLGYPGVLARDAGYRRHYVEVEDGATGEAQELRYRAVRVEHGGDKLECFGFQATVAGRRLAYTGDTSWCNALFTLANDVEVLVTDCTYPQGFNLPEHLSFDEVRQLRGKIDPHTTMILTHLSGFQTSAGLDRVHVASDLATFSFD